LVLRLAERETQLTVRELADREGLPETTVAKVISRLRRAGVVTAERGRKGGYSLARPADALTLASVVGAFETRVFDSRFCQRMTPGDGSCTHAASCGLRPVWRGLTAVIGAFLSKITIADIIAGELPDTTAAAGGLPVLATVHMNS
jgi:cysteine desulfurase